MPDNDIHARVLEAAKAKYPKSKKFRIVGEVDDFLGGDLFTVESVDEDGDETEDIAHVVDGHIELFTDVEEMARSLKIHQKKTQLDRILQIGGISGLLAVGMLATIAYLAIIGNPVPEVLSNGLGLVIGFYFGNQVAK